MKKIIIIFIFIFFTSLTFADSNMIYKRIELPNNNSQYSEVKKMKIELWIGYTSTSNEFISRTGKIKQIIESISYFSKKGEQLTFLGSINKNGAFDKDGKIIKSVVVKQSLVLGVSSSSLTNALAPNLVVKDNAGKIKETDPFVLLRYDFAQKTIQVFTPNY